MALGVVFVSGLLFLLVTLTGVRERLLTALSTSMRGAIAAGIGLFIAFIGLQNAGLVIQDPGTAVTLNPDFASPDLIVFFFGLLLTAGLQARQVRGSLLWGMGGGLGLALVLRWTLPALPDGVLTSARVAESVLMTRFEVAGAIVAAPPSLAPTLLKMDLAGALSLTMMPLVLIFLFMDLFDTLGTLVGVSEQAGLMRDGRLPRARKAMMSDALGTVAGACLGTSTVTSFIESAAGVQQGGRTGLTGLTTAGLFLIAPFFSPVVAMIGSYPPITAPALVVVGALMMGNIVRVEWDDPTEAIPAFLTFVGIPLTYSIADGLALGFMSYPVVKLLGGRGTEVSWLMKWLGLILVLYFLFLRANVA